MPHFSVKILSFAIVHAAHTRCTHTNQVKMDFPNLLQSQGMAINVLVAAFMWQG